MDTSSTAHAYALHFIWRAEVGVEVGVQVTPAMQKVMQIRSSRSPLLRGGRRAWLIPQVFQQLLAVRPILP
jgi:hypothetical protein